MRRTPHITHLPPNYNGRDIIIGDIHGRSRGLKNILQKLTPQDRFFCSGDLFDRGPDSIGVFQVFKEYINKGTQVFLVHGNHETFFLATMNALTEWRVNRTINLTAASNILAHLSNGGKWIFGDENKSAAKEMQHFFSSEQKIIANDITKTEAEKTAAINVLKQHCTLNLLTHCDNVLTNEAHWNVLNEISQMIKSLPYIIFVGQFAQRQNAFLLCHGDMPINDQELEDRLTLQHNKIPFLSNKEIHHVTWARPDSLKNKTSTAQGVHIITNYTGHNVVHSVETTLLKLEGTDNDSEFVNATVVRPIRKETNTVVLDISGWKFNHSEDELFLVVDHNARTAFVDGTAVTPIESYTALRILTKEITTHLSDHQSTACVLNELLQLNAALTHYLECRTSIIANTSLFSPRTRLHIVEAKNMLQETERLLHKKRTEVASTWQPQTNLSKELQQISDRLQTACIPALEDWVLVSQTESSVVAATI